MDLVDNSTHSESRWLVPGLIMRRKQDGRAVYSDQGKAAVVRLVNLGESSVPVIARVNGVNHNVVHKWVKGYKDKPRAAKSNQAKAQLVRVQMAAQPTAQPATACGAVEVTLPGGTIRLQACSDQQLQTILAHLSGLH
jgi:transposase-like protein